MAPSWNNVAVTTILTTIGVATAGYIAYKNLSSSSSSSSSNSNSTKPVPNDSSVTSSRSNSVSPKRRKSVSVTSESTQKPAESSDPVEANVVVVPIESKKVEISPKESEKQSNGKVATTSTPAMEPITKIEPKPVVQNDVAKPVEKKQRIVASPPPKPVQPVQPIVQQQQPPSPPKPKSPPKNYAEAARNARDQTPSSSPTPPAPVPSQQPQQSPEQRKEEPAPVVNEPSSSPAPPTRSWSAVVRNTSPTPEQQSPQQQSASTFSTLSIVPDNAHPTDYIQDERVLYAGVQEQSPNPESPKQKISKTSVQATKEPKDKFLTPRSSWIDPESSKSSEIQESTPGSFPKTQHGDNIVNGMEFGNEEAVVKTETGSLWNLGASEFVPSFEPAVNVSENATTGTSGKKKKKKAKSNNSNQQPLPNNNSENKPQENRAPLGQKNNSNNTDNSNNKKTKKPNTNQHSKKPLDNSSRLPSLFDFISSSANESLLKYDEVCKYWPKCKRGDECLYRHGESTSVSTENVQEDKENAVAV